MRFASCLALLLTLGCKKEAEPIPVAPPQPAAKPAPAPRPPVPPPIEAEYGDKYLVILSSSPTPGAQPPSIAALEAKPDLAAKIARLDSSKFKNLMPCYEIVIARAFDALAEARAWSKELAALKIDHYVKNAGKYVGRQPTIDSYCEAKRSEEPDQCGGVRFVEKWEDSLFVPLGEAVDEPKNLAPFKGNRAVWRAPLEEKVHGAHRAGGAMILIDPSGEQARCKITGFSVLVRGHPHFGYFQNADGEQMTEPPKNDAPGCGEPEVFADLECPSSFEGEVALAIAHDKPPPLVYGFSSPEVDEHALSQAVIAAMKKTSEYTAARAEAEQSAREKSVPLEERYGFREAAGGERKILVVRTIMSTGEGLIDCGAEDVRVEIEGAYEVKDGAIGSIALPFRRVELRRLSSILDLERDGKLETFDLTPPTQFTVHRSDDTEACELVVPFCDCGC